MPLDLLHFDQEVVVISLLRCGIGSCAAGWFGAMIAFNLEEYPLVLLDLGDVEQSDEDIRGMFQTFR